MHRETRVANYVLASLAVISLTLLSLPLSGPVRTFKACLTYVLNPVAYYGDKGFQRFADVPPNIRDLVDADVQNKVMERRAKAAWISAENDALKIENGRLRAALSLKSPGSRAPLWAHVMQRDPLTWYRSFMVDAGSSDGVMVNAPVLGFKNDKVVVIGRVKETRPNDSVVLLVTDELSAVATYSSSASTETERQDYEGLLQGQGTSRLRMNYLPTDAKVQAGDLVYTSPTSATFPPDLLVGTVSRVLPLDPFLAFQAVEVQPAIDASSLKEVMILKAQNEAQPVAVPAPKEAPDTQDDDDGGDQS